MSNFRLRYDEKLPFIQAAIDDLPARIDEYIPGITRPALKRFFQRFSVLLGRIDKDGAKNPAFLAYHSGMLIEYVISSADAVVDSLRAGPETFFNNQLPELVWAQMQLERAVGVSSDELKNLTHAISEDLRSALMRSEEGLQSIRSVLDESKSIQLDLRQAQSEARKGVVSSTQSVENIESLRNKLELLASSDGRKKDSLENLVKSVRAKAEEINKLGNDIKEIAQRAEDSAGEVYESLRNADVFLKSIEKIEDQAKKTLNLSTQAGLAASYLRESASLRSRANIFTGVLYATAATTVGVAAFYVIPSLEHVISAEHSVATMVPVAILRATILAPLIFIFYFTTKQINSVETLRMDYAEKAAASLAYSGYKDEMSLDNSLLERLRASLLMKFAEHPERLLRKRPSQEKVEVEAPGFKATASTAEYPDNTNQAQED